MQDIWPKLKNWVETQRSFALATVVKVSGSSPRGVGATLAITADGSFLGSVSAGCIENAVIEAAQQVLADGKTRWLDFDVANDYPWEVALTCGGKIRVRIDPSPFENTDDGLKAKLTGLLDQKEAFILAGCDGSFALKASDANWVGELANKATSLCPKDFRVATEAESVLFIRFATPPTLYIIGATHIATHLVRFAKELGYQGVVIDPREAYAREERFAAPPEKLICDWPNKILQSKNLVAQDAAVLLTHDAKIDDDALEAFLNSPIGYIGALGSKRSHAARLKRLAAKGFPEEQLARIKGPVGLDIGSETPAEIAISIAAEIVQRRQSKA